MRCQGTVSFAACVRSPARVRLAFCGVPGAATWWRVILALHGKPTGDIPADAARPVVAAGFAFYAYLYGGLALLFLAVSLACWQVAHLWTWGWAGMVASAYLFAASAMAHNGSVLLTRSPYRGTVCLVLFLVMITVFLSVFLAGMSMAAAFSSALPLWANLLLLLGAVVLGIGSYMIELVYLIHGVAKEE